MKYLKIVSWIGLSVLFSSTAWTEELSVNPQPAPGTYFQNTSVQVDKVDGQFVSYEILEGDHSSVEYSKPLYLTAVPGESRTYTLRLTSKNARGESLSKDYVYKIDRRGPAFPSIDPLPGYYTQAQTVKAVFDSNYTVLLNAKPVQFPLKLDSPVGELRTFLFQVVSQSGKDFNVVREWNYAIDRRGQTDPEIRILSPTPGVWSNDQLVAIDSNGVENVRWALSSEPDRWSNYWKPTLLGKTGKLTLFVVGTSRRDGSTVKTKVDFEIRSDAPAIEMPASQWTDHELELAPPAEGWQVSSNEGKSWDLFLHPQKEAVRPNSVRAVSYCLKEKSRDSIYRYFYVLDDRTPSVPVLTTWGGFIPQVAFSGASDALFEARWEGISGEALHVLGPSGFWNAPAGATALRIKAIYPNLRESAESRVTLSTLRSSTPVWEPLTWGTAKTGLPAGGDVRSTAGLVPIFEMAEVPNVPIPSVKSPVFLTPLVPDLPQGNERTFFIRLAWRDESGKVGPSTAPIAFHTDKKAPQSPTFQVSSTQVTWTQSSDDQSDTQLFYALTSDPIRNLDRLVFVRYTNPIPVPQAQEGQVVTQYLHAYEQDSWGNTSALKQNIVLRSDKRPFSFLHFFDDATSGAEESETALLDQGIYSKSRILVRPEWQGEANDIECLVSEQEDLPTDWADQMQKVSSAVSLSLNPGQRKTFVLFWNAKIDQNWLLETPVRLRLTIDLALPEDPSIENRNPGEVLSSAWKLRATAAKQGDRLTYTVSDDGSLPADPLLEKGVPWPGSLTLDTEEGSTKTYRVRMAVVSAAGLSREIEALGPVKIDKTSPGPVTTSLEEWSVNKSSKTAEFKSNSDLIRYQLSENGEIPDWPDEQSPTLKDGKIVFPGKEGERVLYRIRLRAYSFNKRPGPVSSVYSVLVDRTAPNNSATVSEENIPKEVEVSIQGLPERTIVNSAVTLSPVTSEGTLRYELVEGDLFPPEVTASSNAFPKQLVLDVPSGSDRSFQLAAAVYDSNGQRISTMKSWKFRIDKVIPEKPNVNLIVEQRRPEVRLVAVNTPADMELYFRWIWKTYPDGKDETPWTKLETPSQTFRSPQDLPARVTVETYTKDLAGNTSPAQSQTVFLDQNVVYVSANSVQGDGSRTKPFATLAQAFEKMRNEGKRILFLAQGSYSIEKTQDMTNWSIWGGLSSTEWEETQVFQASQIVPSPAFAGTNLFEAYEGTAELHSLVVQIEKTPLSSVVSCQKTQARVENVQFIVKGPIAKVWNQTGGALVWKNGSGTLQDSLNTSFMVLESASLQLNQLNLSAQKNDQPVFFKFSRTEGTLSDIVVVSKKDSGVEQAFSLSNSQLTFANVRLLMGEGADRSLAYQVDRSHISLYNLDLTLNAEKSNLGIQSDSSQLETDHLQITIPFGVEYNQGLVASQSQLKLTYTNVTIGSGDYQGVMSVQEGSLSTEILNAELKGGGNRAWGIQFIGKCLVSLKEGSWKLSTETPGSCWILDKPWLQGSYENRNEFKGWKSIQSPDR